MRQPLSWRRGGAVALAALIVVMGGALVLDAGGGADIKPLEDYLERSGMSPAELIERVGRSGQILILSDIDDRPEPKRLAAEAVEVLAQGPGLDAVVLEVSSEEQAYIDSYLNAVEEDATVLLSRPAAVREGEGVPRAFLDIYRAVWRQNRELGATRQIRIIAADLPGWPPPPGTDPDRIAELYTERAEHMLQRMRADLLDRMPEARMLVFVDGYQALKRTHGEIRFPGVDPVRVDWFGSMLSKQAGLQVRTILVDAGTGTSGVLRLPTYRGTRFYRPLRRELNETVGARVEDTFSVMPDPVIEISSPAVRVDIAPDTYVLRDVADGYIFVRGG